MDERRLLSTTRQGSSDVVRSNFSQVRRGYDPDEVNRHLETIAREMAHLENRLHELQTQLADANRRALNPVLDEETLVAALGAQSAAILRAAHDEAARVTAEAQERSSHIFSQAQERGTASLMEAQERASKILTEAENAAADLDLEARSASERLISSAKLNGDALVERAREQGRAIIEQAQEARKVVLNDLAVRRTALHLQIDQLRAARDTLSGALGSVREEIEEVVSGINSSDEDARAAALEALRSRKESPPPSEEELLAGVPLRHIPEAPAPPNEPAVPPVSPPPAPAAVEPELTSTIEPTTDVVEEIFARLRKATLEERGVATASSPVSARRSTTPDFAPTASELFAHRDEALEPSLTTIIRRVKRALQDDQNIMLERLRDVTGMITTELEDELVQRGRYADAAVDALRDAAIAGEQFAQSEFAATGTWNDDVAVAECAADLAVTIVVALRKRLLGEASGDALALVNAAYKEWRGPRIERLCADAGRRAFHQGVVTALLGRSLRFFAAPTDVPCDACALDASSPERPAGSVFPSGSAFPPLHAGCTCTIAAV